MNKNENIIGKNSSQKNYEMSNISPMKEILIERSESLSGPLAPLYLPKNKPQHSDLTVNVNKDRGNFIFKAKSQKFHRHHTSQEEIFPENSKEAHCNDYVKEIANTFYLLNKNIVFTDNLLRLISIASFLEDISEGKNIFANSPKFEMKLPWEDEMYKETIYKTYNKNNIHFNIAQFFEKFGQEILFNKKCDYIAIKEYAPIVFNQIRFYDKIDIRALIWSLNPLNGIKEIISDYYFNNTRGSSHKLLLYTHDKKYLIKTISKEEKEKFIDMLPYYHERLVDHKSLLARIYGLFSIQISKKENAYIILMKNMNIISLEVYYCYSF